MRPSESASPQGPDSERVYSVSALNAEIHLLLETTYPVVWLEGEISNFRSYQSSGHWYFTLKDSGAQIAAAMFRSRNRRVRVPPEDGMSVRIRGQLSLYEPRGTFQIVVWSMEPTGAGALAARYEALKARLQEEGLFDAARKRPLPALPRRIGVVTSPDGAALRDVLRVLRRRHSGLSVLVIPTRVQGPGAADEIAAAVQRASRIDNLDALIVGRGGGSLEDLWAFNEEVVARAVAACPLPVISAVGHEVDVTITDFVADVRAPTPSAAAAMVVASRAEMLERVTGLSRRLAAATRLVLSRLRAGPAGAFPLLGARLLDVRLRRSGQRLDELASRVVRGCERRLARQRRQWEILTSRLSPRSLLARLDQRRERLKIECVRLAHRGRAALDRQRGRMAMLGARLQDLSPLAVLDRGYALVRVSGTGEVLRDVARVGPGAGLDVQVSRGQLRAEVREVLPDSADRSRPRGRSS